MTDSDSTNPIPAGEDPEEIALELARVKKISEDLIAEQEAAKKEQEPFDQEIAEMEKQIQAIKRKKWATQEKIAKARHDLNINGYKVSDLENKLRAAQIDKMRREEWEKKTAVLDQITETAEWRGKAMQHQIDGAKHIAVLDGKVLLADKPGLGKSMTSLMVADMLDAQKIVVISKAEILKNFEKEVVKWASWRTMFSLVSEKRSFRTVALKQFLPKMDEFILLVNFEAWRNDKQLIHDINKLQPDMVIIDEAHHAKEIDKRAFQGARDIVYAHNKCNICGFGGLSFLGSAGWECQKCYVHLKREETHSVKHVIPMTGSPILNRPEEIFALLYLIDKDSFPSKNGFLRQYCAKVEFTNLMGKKAYRWAFRQGGERDLLKAIGPQFLQRTRESAGVELPENQKTIHELELDRTVYPNQWRAYRDLERTMGTVFNNDGTSQQMAPVTITLIQRYRQITSWPAGIKITEKDEEGNRRVLWQCDVTESIKVDKAIELAQEMVDNGERVIIFSKFTEPILEMRKRFQEMETEDGNKIRSAVYHGPTPRYTREEIKADFDAGNFGEGKRGPKDYKYDVVICQYDAAGEGLTFNHATNMICVDEEWNPEKNNQAHSRHNRIGQKNKTSVHILRIADTIDTDLGELILDKEAMIDGFESEAVVIGKFLERLRKRVEDNG